MPARRRFAQGAERQDATAYSFLANVLSVPVESPLKAHAQQNPQLEAYCRRMKERYYSK